MAKSDHITFEVQQTPNGNWHVVAYCPGPVRGVTSFKSHEEAVDRK
jgi:hypothetical protein